MTLCLLASIVIIMQYLLDVFYDYDTKHDILFPIKSVCTNYSF